MTAPNITIEEILALGNRSAFERYIIDCPKGDLLLAWVRSARLGVPDFYELAGAAMVKRGFMKEIPL